MSLVEALPRQRRERELRQVRFVVVVDAVAERNRAARDDDRDEHVGDVHLLASAYGWSEPSILALPHDRRVWYAELVRGVA